MESRISPSVLWPSWLAGPVGFGLLSLAFGQDVNWDLRNYHYYNPYAFLTGRFGFDIAPAQLPTFYNPLLHVPYYWLVESLPPRGVGFVLGAVQGLNLPLLFYIARRLLPAAGPVPRNAFALALAVAGMLGGGMLSQLGASFFDNVLSLFFLAALAVLLAGHDRLIQGGLGKAAAIAAGAGLVLGVAVGLKQTMVIYAFGLTLACLCLATGRWRALALAIAFGTGILAGIAAGGGYWMWLLWETYGNPIFPHMNSLFQAPMAPLTDRRDPAFLPKSFQEALAYPYLFTLDSQRVGEIAFRDIRILLAYVLVPLALLSTVWRRLFDRPPRPRLTRKRAGRFVLVAAAGTYLAWLPLFSIYRYLIGLELLAPLVVLLALDRLPMTRRVRLGATVAAIIAMLALVQPGSWGRASWPETDDYFAVPVPPIPDPADTLVLLAGWQPSSYVIPKFPPAIRFIRIQGNFTSPEDVENRHNALMQEIVRAHRGAVYTLFTDHEHAAVGKALRGYGLEIMSSPCREIFTNLDRQLLLCPLQRVPN